jgi:hypothetical protein
LLTIQTHPQHSAGTTAGNSLATANNTEVALFLTVTTRRTKRDEDRFDKDSRDLP